MYSMKDIENILKSYNLEYSKYSSFMMKFSLKFKPEINIGYISLSDNNILCRFYYKTPELSYSKTFYYEKNKFIKEINIAHNNLIKLYNKEINEFLNTF